MLKPAVDFEVNASEVVGPAGGQPALVSKVLAGSPLTRLLSCCGTSATGTHLQAAVRGLFHGGVFGGPETR
jgi:hypothetical protein